MLSTALSQSHTADTTPCLAPLLPQFGSRYAPFSDQLLYLFSPKTHCDDGFAVFLLILFLAIDTVSFNCLAIFSKENLEVCCRYEVYPADD
jgi:hypothetical protein